MTNAQLCFLIGNAWLIACAVIPQDDRMSVLAFVAAVLFFFVALLAASPLSKGKKHD